MLQTETCGGLHSFDLFKLSVPEPPTDNPEYVGCYADDKTDRVMTHKVVSPDGMTPAVCREHCSDKDALYYGTQVGYGLCRLVGHPSASVLSSRV